MTWLFVASLLFGGGLIAIGLLGKDTDHGDLGGGHDAGPGFDHDTGFLALFSLRNLAWGSFAFGAMGLLAIATKRSTFVTLASSISFGLATFLVVSWLFRALGRSEVGVNPSDSIVIGATGSLVLPFNEDGLGVVSLTAGGQQIELPARRSEETKAVDVSMFAVCTIEWIDAGVAVVSPAVDHLPGRIDES